MCSSVHFKLSCPLVVSEDQKPLTDLDGVRPRKQLGHPTLEKCKIYLFT